MLTPNPLKKGDQVAITAASGVCDPAKLQNGILTLEKIGLKVKVMPSCYAKHDYLAGTDIQRAADLHEAFADKSIRAIFMARGGYGAARLLPLINFNLIRQNPKILVGFSDVTALHIAINQICKLVTYHGPMPAATFGTSPINPITLESLVNTIMSRGQGDVSPRSSYQLNILYPGNASGILTGGNLTLIAASLGTPYEIKTRGRILFMEETQEAPYRVDRLFLQLKQARKFKHAAGIILGDFSPETTETLHTAISELILTEKKPTLSGLPCGHTTPNITLPLGGWAKIMGSKESAHQLEIHIHPEKAMAHKRF